MWLLCPFPPTLKLCFVCWKADCCQAAPAGNKILDHCNATGTKARYVAWREERMRLLQPASPSATPQAAQV